MPLLFMSCNDMLDRFPLDKLAPENYFNNEAELRTYTNNFYNMLPVASTMYGERFDAVVGFTLEMEVAGQRTVPTTGGGWSWNQLRNVNEYLKYSHRCNDVSARNRYDGLAKFFRAYFYFEKVKRFGDVPWYDKPLASNDPDLFKSRDSRDYILERMMVDINEAIDNLPEVQDVYRVTKWTALALKSRICLFEGTFRKYHGLDNSEFFLDQCIEASQRFISESPYRIDNKGTQPYRQLFSSMNADETEVVLARDYDKAKGVVHEANYYTMATTYGQPGMNKKVVNSYLMKDGSRFTDISGFETMTYYQEMQNRDPRLAQTIVGPGYTRIGDTKKLFPDFSSSVTGYQMTKWVTSAAEDGYMNSCNDFILFRAAEIYLNYAEAKAERGTLTQSDLDISIKPIRDRVGMPNMNMAFANSNPDPYLESPVTGYKNVGGANKGIILEIRRERTIELIVEGHRYYDIMRWKEGKTFENEFYGMYFPDLGVYDLDGDGKNDICLYQGEKPSPSTNPEVKGIRVFLEVGVNFILTEGTKGNIIIHDTKHFSREWKENRDYLYPIPTQERLLTNGALTQNPNWVDGLPF